MSSRHTQYPAPVTLNMVGIHVVCTQFSPCFTGVDPLENPRAVQLDEVTVAFRGRVTMVSATSVDDKQRLNICIAKTAGKMKIPGPFVVQCSVSRLHANFMFPGSDAQVWNYLPAWFFNVDNAADALNKLLQACATEEFDALRLDGSNEDDGKGFSVLTSTHWQYTLGRQKTKGQLGRYTPREFRADNLPVTSDGSLIYQLVVDTCTVRFALDCLLIKRKMLAFLSLCHFSCRSSEHKQTSNKRFSLYRQPICHSLQTSSTVVVYRRTL